MIDGESVEDTQAWLEAEIDAVSATMPEAEGDETFRAYQQSFNTQGNRRTRLRGYNIRPLQPLQGYAYVAAYTASKHALLGYSRAAALELERKGVTVNVVCPHYVDSPMTEASIDRVVEKTGRSREEAAQFFASQNPGGRLVQPLEVAEAAFELCSGEANGAVIELDGSER